MNDGVVNLFWVRAGLLPATGRPCRIRTSASNSKLTGTPPREPPPTIDLKQHPYFRAEMLQKAMNLTTVRTHQYAVWITVGFFEVTRQGDLLMAGSSGNPPPPWPSTSSGPRSAPHRPDDAVPGLLPGRPDPAHRLRSQRHRQLPPGRRLSPDHRIMTLIVVSCQN